jgi:UDP-N-acetylmuramoylalanine-D-glutamate ligase
MELRGRRVLIWGFGHHGGGLAAARFCAARGALVSVLEKKSAEALGAGGAEAIAQGWAWHLGDASHPVILNKFYKEKISILS